MKINHAFTINTNVLITVIDTKTKAVLDTYEEHNMVVDTGFNLLRDFIGHAVGNVGLTYFAIGTDDTTVTASDTTLGTEVHRDVFTDTNYSNRRVTISFYLPSGTANGETLTEAGLFGHDATAVADTGTLFARVVHADIVKTDSIEITYTWQIDMANA